MNKWYAILTVAILVSCSSIDCSVNSLVRTKYQFYHSNGDSLSLLDTMTILTVRMDGSDTIIYDANDDVVFNKGVGISSFHLPISYSHPEDVLVFIFDRDSLQMSDTVWVKKDDYPHFESVDCNASFFHNLTNIRYTQNCFDSIVIVNPSVTNDDQVLHVRIYPKTGD